MPSPIGHMLAGATVGQLIAGRTAPARHAPYVMVLAFAITGSIADVDLLAGVHSGPTHSISLAVMAGLLACVASAIPPRLPGSLRMAAAVAAAYATHPLLDWLSTDTVAPFGIMALWPFTTEYYLSPFRVFLPVSRHYWLLEAWIGNLRALIRELLVLGPLFCATWWWTRREQR